MTSYSLEVEALPFPAAVVNADGLLQATNQKYRRRCGSSTPKLGAPPPPWDDPAAAPVTLPLSDSSQLLVWVDFAKGLPRDLFHLSRLAAAGKLMSAVVHEINNALSGIVGYSQLLQEKCENSRLQADVQRIHQEAIRTSQVVDNLLRFSRQGTGRQQPIDLRGLIRRCLELKQRSLRLKSIELDLDLEPSLPHVLGDEGLLLQVLINLITNAEQSIHGVRDHGRIRLQVRRREDSLVLEVSDDGPGVPAEIRDSLFEPFVTRRSGEEGTGLGLSLCREILEQHDAQIELADGPGPGACFRVTLPTWNDQESSAEPELPKSSRPRPIRGRRIVVVEDEPVIREIVTRALTGNRNRIVAFERGEDALPYLESEAVDLVISDIHRPGLNGVDLYRGLATRRPELLGRFLFLTGDTVGKSTQEFLERSRAHHLAKPILIEELQAKVEEILRERDQPGGLFAESPSRESSSQA